MARVKHVVDYGMVAHLWAHKAQDEARNAQRNFFFEGDTIYSYGHHFPIARHVSNKRGEAAVLLTTRTYSHTTAGHVECVRGACRHLTVFNVLTPTNNGRPGQFAEYRHRQVNLMQQYAKARGRKPDIFAQIRKLVEEANAFAAFFGLRTRLRMPEDEAAMGAECERIAKANEAKAARERKRDEKEAAEYREKQRKRLEAWVAGDSAGDGGRWSYSDLPTRLRIHDGKLETSLGASVPLAEAKRVFKILRKLRKRGEKYQRNGETIRLGLFALDSMDETGTVKVGCHTVAWEECERVAALAGVK